MLRAYEKQNETVTLSTLLLETEDYLAHIRLNRPEKLNAIDPTMARQLTAALDQIESDDAIRVVLLTGNGRAFSAGFDLNGGAAEPGESAEEQLRRELIEAFDAILRLRNCPLPTIAAVHGYCLGSSMELAAVCDITVTSADCEFGAPEVRFGSGIVCMILPWIVGEKAAREILLTGARIDAQRALDIGLVTRVTPDGQQVTEARQLAREIALNDSLAVQMTKRAMNRSQEISGLEDALRMALETDLQIEATQTPESKQFNDILEKDGLKAALAWREDLLSTTSRKENTA